MVDGSVDEADGADEIVVAEPLPGDVGVHSSLGLVGCSELHALNPCPVYRSILTVNFGLPLLRPLHRQWR